GIRDGHVTGVQTCALPISFAPGDTLLFGRESAGVPDHVHDAADARLRIPLRPGLRSLNLAQAAAMALGEALRQTGGFVAEGEGEIGRASCRERGWREGGRG